MQFNRRVLEEAEDAANPLLERVKFLAITGSNLDEYVEIRQAGLMQRIEDGNRQRAATFTDANQSTIPMVLLGSAAFADRISVRLPSLAETTV